MEDKELIEFCEKFVRLILKDLEIIATEEAIKDVVGLSFDTCLKYPELTEKQIRYIVYREMFFNANQHKENHFFGEKDTDPSYPKYAPHIILGTNKSILDEVPKDKTIKNVEKFLDWLVELDVSHYKTDASPFYTPSGNSHFYLKGSSERFTSKDMIEIFTNCASDETNENWQNAIASNIAWQKRQE